jgi:hypothetical protein
MANKICGQIDSMNSLSGLRSNTCHLIYASHDNEIRLRMLLITGMITAIVKGQRLLLQLVRSQRNFLTIRSFTRLQWREKRLEEDGDASPLTIVFEAERYGISEWVRIRAMLKQPDDPEQRIRPRGSENGEVDINTDFPIWLIAEDEILHSRIVLDCDRSLLSSIHDQHI